MTDNNYILRNLDQRLTHTEVRTQYLEARVRQIEMHRDILAILVLSGWIAFIVYMLIRELG